MSQRQYTYQACDLMGKIQTGQLTADNEQEVVNILQSRQLVPLTVEQQVESASFLGGKKFSNRDLIDFTSGLCTLIEARIPLDRALLLLEDLTVKPSVNQLIADLRQNVKEGKSLAEALQAHPDVFSRMYVNMIHAGEEGGILEFLLPKLAEFLSAADAAKNRIISSLIYPMILLIVGILSVIFLMVFVVPQFSKIFADMGSNIPTAAAFLLGVSRWLQTWWWTLPAVPFAGWYLWHYMGSTPENRLQRDNFLLSLPIFGNLVLEAESSRFCRTLGALLGAGIPLLKALHIARGVMENQVIANSLAEVEENVRGGGSLGKALVKTGKFPILLPQLVIVGEESGRTAIILEKLAGVFDENVKRRTGHLVSLAEPLLIAFLGILVGAIAITMLSAIFSINDVNF